MEDESTPPRHSQGSQAGPCLLGCTCNLGRTELKLCPYGPAPRAGEVATGDRLTAHSALAIID
jgi:hypothetical protein